MGKPEIQETEGGWRGDTGVRESGWVGKDGGRLLGCG